MKIMELDSFVNTAEDFLAGRIYASFFKEEIIFIEEEIENYRQDLEAHIEEDTRAGIEMICDGLNCMMTYFTEAQNKEYIKTGLEQIKKGSIIVNGE